MKTALAICGLFLLSLGVYASSGVQVTDSANNLLYVISQGVLHDASNNQALLTIRGNIVYRDSSQNREDIVLMVRTENIFDKNLGQVFANDMNTVLFSVSRGKFFEGDNGVYNPAFIMAYYKMDNKGNLGLYNNISNELLAWVKGNEVSTGELTAIFYLFMKNLGLDQQILAKAKIAAPVSTKPIDVSQTKGSIKRVWNTGNDEFVWDGYTIKRKWNSVTDDEWTFDGQVLKRAWGTDGVVFTWDGQYLKRKFDTGTDEFEWDGKILRRRWNTGTDEFSIGDNEAKRIWGTNNQDEWEIDGDVPIPVIGMVVFGLLSK